MTVTIHVGHVIDELRKLPGDSVHLVCSSPPYFNLRQYSGEPQIWGGDDSCKHEWGSGLRHTGPSRFQGNTGQRSNRRGTTARETPRNAGAFCSSCGAWCGALGLEPDLSLYIEHMVSVFTEVWRVLRSDGLVFLNLGDGYASRPSGIIGKESRLAGSFVSYNSYRDALRARAHCGVPSGFKNKDLMMVPARVAIALQEWGWYLRSDVIWKKDNPLPEPVTDRPSVCHEHVFLLAKSETYYYDRHAILEPNESGPSDLRKMAEGLDRIGGKHKMLDDPLSRASAATNIGQKRSVGQPTGRNKRSVWTVNTEPFSEPHFAVMPTRLVEPMILVGTSAAGVCSICGAPWKRIVGAKEETGGRGSGNKERKIATQGERSRTNAHLGSSVPWAPTTTLTIGWEPTCQHGVPPKPATVLDPFGGAGTTGLVAERLGRDAILIELSEEYARMARDRIAADPDCAARRQAETGSETHSLVDRFADRAPPSEGLPLFEQHRGADS